MTRECATQTKCAGSRRAGFGIAALWTAAAVTQSAWVYGQTPPAEAIAGQETGGAPVAPLQPEAGPKPAPYSLPWQLRPVSPGSVVRSDTAIAFYEDPASANGGSTVATTLLAAYKVTPWLAPAVRIGVVGNSAPDPGEGAVSFVNPVVGATAGTTIAKDYRLGFFLGMTIPVGMGGGDTPDPATAAATGSGIYSRSAMDNAMFAVDYLTVFPGVDVAYVAHGVTVQVEATLLQLIRVRGSAVQKDEARTNFTTGLHVGYFFVPKLSVGADLRYQRWLSTPTAVVKDDTKRDALTFAVGPRVHLKLSDKIWLRPGIAYARGIDKPMSSASYNIIQIDVPVAF